MMVREPSAPRGALSVLVALYSILTLAALGRSGYQIATKFELAPLAYTLSAVAAVVYVVATVALVLSSRSGAHRVALVAVGFEAVGVLVVGTLSVALPELFPADAVWSDYGRGYLFIPLVLPFLGLRWLLAGRVKRRGLR